jgi:two-component system, OmpR family, KDP operon response regulator KdpE
MRVFVTGNDNQTAERISLCISMGFPGATIISFRERQKAIEMIETEPPDLVFIFSYPPKNGIVSSIQKIRKSSEVSLIIVFETHNELDTAAVLEAGADDCITRSVGSIELVARCKAVMRRSRKPNSTGDHSKSLGELRINFATHQVFLSGNQVILSPTEYRLLSELLMNEGTLVSHEELLTKLWGNEYVGDGDLIKTYVYRLRLKLKSDTNGSPQIITHRGIGYRLIGSHDPT